MKHLIIIRLQYSLGSTHFLSNPRWANTHNCLGLTMQKCSFRVDFIYFGFAMFRICLGVSEAINIVKCWDVVLILIIYSYGTSLTYGYLISPMKMRLLREGKTNAKTDRQGSWNSHLDDYRSIHVSTFKCCFFLMTTSSASFSGCAASAKRSL